MKGLFLALFITLFTVSATFADDGYQTTCSVKVLQNLDGTWGSRFSTTGSINSFSVWSCATETGENLNSGSFQYDLDVPLLTTGDGAPLEPPFSCSASVQGLDSTCTMVCSVVYGSVDCEATSR